MAVVIETTLGDITIDLYTTERPRACMNFLKLCKMKYYNFNLFHTIQHSFLAQTGDPTGSRTGGESIWGVLEGSLKRYFEAEEQPKMKHTNVGTVSFVCNSEGMIGSQFFITLSSDLISLDNKHCVFGEVAEGLDILRKLNEAICDEDDRPFQDIRITHTIILEDPFRDPPGFIEPDKSPEANAERLQGGRIGADEQIDETVGKSAEELAELAAEREAKARATILEMIGDIPDAEMAPPENVLFVCKLNPVTTDDDLQIIFSRFGKIKNCEVIRDKQSGDSLQYAFIEFEEKKSCEDAYFKMDNVLIDDRRIHVDFSQSVAKVKWLGKGRGVQHYDDKGQKQNIRNSNIGNGDYKGKERRNDNEEINKKDGYRRNKEDNYNYKRENDNRRQDYYYNKNRNFDKQDNFYNRKQKESEGRYYREEKYVSKYDNNDRYRRRNDERGYRQIDERKKDSYRKPDDKQYERDRILKEDRYSHKRDEQRRDNYNIDKYKSNRKRTNSESDEETNRKNEKYKYKRDLINENISEKVIKENKKQKTVYKEKERKTKNKSDSESSSDESSKRYKKKKKSDKKKKVSSSSDSSEEDSKKKHKKKRKKKVSESSSSSASDTPKKKNKR